MKETYFDLATNSYKRDNDEVIHELSSDVKKSKILFYVSTVCIVLTLALIVSNLITAIMGFMLTIYFLIMIIILFPKISVFNKDALDIRTDNLEEIENKVLAVFPIDDANKTKDWMIFVQLTDTEYIELEVPYEVGNALKEEDVICVKYTKNTKIVMNLIKK